MSLFTQNTCTLTGLAAALLAVGNGYAGAKPNVGLPEVKPPFMAEKTARQDFVLSVDKNVKVRPKTMNDVPSFKAEGKRLSFYHLGLKRPGHFGIFIDAISKKIAALQISPSAYVPGAKIDRSLKGKIKVDEKNQKVIYSKEYYYTKDKKALFTFEISNAGKGKIKLSWNNGLTAEQVAKLPRNSAVGVGFVVGVNLQKKFGASCNGKELRTYSAEELKVGHKPKDWCRKNILNSYGAKVKFFTKDPKSTVSLDFNKSFNVRITESTWYSPIKLSKPRVGLSVRATHPLQQNASLIIDMGETGVKSADNPPPVANIDFYGRDRLHFPTLPTRNLVPNPSFEQGLRYMRWVFGGGGGGLSPIPSYTISNDAKFGNKSLKLQKSPRGNFALMTFPIPVVFGKTYTMSFYAKSLDKDNQILNFKVFNPLTNFRSKVLGRGGKQPTWKVDKKWKRFTFTFKSDTRAVCLVINSYRNILIDGIQLEEGDKATAFISPEVEGNLITSDPDNMIDKDKQVDAKFVLFGKPGLNGKVRIRVKDFYNKFIFDKSYDFKLDKKGAENIKLPLDQAKLGSGVFMVRADYTVNGKKYYTDYYRYSKMKFLTNTHPSKNMFNNQYIPRPTRREELARNYMRWGIGSMCGQCWSSDMPVRKAMADKYNIDLGFGVLFGMTREFKDLKNNSYAIQRQNPWGKKVTPWMKITPERAKWIEETAYKMVKKFPYLKAWAPMGETECRWKDYTNGDFTEWRKMAVAFYKGAKRANPNIKLMPCQGTSGFLPEMNRGVVEVTGVMQSVKKDNIKWDYISTHPYFSTDGVNGRSDLDKNTAFLIDLMKKNGYGDTPIIYPEGGNFTSMLIPEWNCNGCQDFYRAGHAGYDSSWGEYRQAFLHARRFIITFKYWPRVQYLDMWTSRPFLDYYLSPLLMCKVVNTLGQLMADPKYVADIKPLKSIRGYAFTDQKNRGLVAIWATVDGVDNGTERGPQMLVKFKGKLPEFIDLMGNQRKVEAENGAVKIQLTSAPLFLRSAPGTVKELVAAFHNAQILGAKNVLDINVLPKVDGSIEAVVSNKTDQKLAGKIKAASISKPFKLAKESKVEVALTAPRKTQFGTMYKWNKPIEVMLGKDDKVNRTMDFEYFYVPYTAKPLPLNPDAPEWKKIPSFKISNWFTNTRRVKYIKHGYKGDLSATYQVAWDKDSLYIRVAVKDDVNAPTSQYSYKGLYSFDNCIEVYFDTGVNARADGREKGYDRDDYRYDFAPTTPEGNRKSGRAQVYRLREVYHQIAGGIEMPTKQEVMDNFQSSFKRTKEGVVYVFKFEQKYIEPFMLKNGSMSGFALYVHDKEPGEKYPRKGLNTSSRAGSHCDNYPKYWPVMVLKK